MRDLDEADRSSAGHEPDEQPDEPEAEGGSGTATEPKLPFMPDENDDSAVGDTDQHSTA